MPPNCRTFIKQSVLGFELLMDNVEESPIDVHLRLPPGGPSLLHLHTPVDRKDWAEHVEGPTGQGHFVDLNGQIAVEKTDGTIIKEGDETRRN